MKLSSPSQTYTLRNLFFYVSLVTVVFWLGWNIHKVANDRAVAMREQAQKLAEEERLGSAHLKELCQTLEKLSGVKKVAVIHGRLNRTNPLDSKLAIAVTPVNSSLDQALRDQIKAICAVRFARVPQEAISIVDSAVVD